MKLIFTYKVIRALILTTCLGLLIISSLFLTKVESVKLTRKTHKKGMVQKSFRAARIRKLPNIPFIAHNVTYAENSDYKDFHYVREIYSSNQAFKAAIFLGIQLNSTQADLIVSFRGTNPKILMNILADIDFIHSRIDGSCQECFVHHGFLSAYQTIADEVFKYIKAAYVFALDSGHYVNQIYFTGHSLGGAMANIAAYYYLNERYNLLEEKSLRLTDIDNLSAKQIKQWFRDASAVYADSDGNYHKRSLLIPKVSLITLGTPKVGNHNFAMFMDSGKKLYQNYRIVHGEDIVTKLPPEAFNFLYQYEHSGIQILYSRDEFRLPSKIETIHIHRTPEGNVRISHKREGGVASPAVLNPQEIERKKQSIWSSIWGVVKRAIEYAVNPINVVREQIEQVRDHTKYKLIDFQGLLTYLNAHRKKKLVVSELNKMNPIN